jgi:hypothetical protein
MLKRMVVSTGKILLCAFTFYFGMILAGMLSAAAGLARN